MWAWAHKHQNGEETTYVELKGDVVFDEVDFGYSDEKIDSMMKTQLSEEMFRKKCKVVIDNSRDFEYTCVHIQEAIKKLEII